MTNRLSKTTRLQIPTATTMVQETLSLFQNNEKNLPSTFLN